MAIRRGQHWVDVPTQDGKRKRTIRNWLNYREPGWTFQPANPRPEVITKRPNNWDGTVEFTHYSQKGALQCYFGDGTDPTNTALIGVRPSEHPGAWLNIKALGVHAVQPTFYPNLKVARWNDVWDNTDLFFRVGAHRLDKRIKLKAAGHPTSFRFALRLPQNASYEIIDSQLIVKDGQGRIRLRTKKPFGWDATGSEEEPNIRMDMIDGGEVTYRGRTFPTVRLRYHPADMVGVTYPVFLDPTLEISGSTDLDDNWMRSDGATDRNFGSRFRADIEYRVVNSARWRCLMRADVSGLPASIAVSDATMSTWIDYGANYTAMTAYGYRILPANTGWVEGTVSGSAQEGSSCWKYQAYSATTPTNWAGGVDSGCGTVDTDIDSSDRVTINVPLFSGEREQFDVALNTDWVEGWANGDYDNAGFLIVSKNDIDDTPVTNERWNYYTQEDGTNPWTLSITYEEVAAGGGGGFNFINYPPRGPWKTPRGDFQEEPKKRTKDGDG